MVTQDVRCGGAYSGVPQSGLPGSGPPPYSVERPATARACALAQQDAAGDARAELRSLLEEAEVVARCESGSSRLSGVYRDIRRVRERLGRALDAEALCGDVERLSRSVALLEAGDEALMREMGAVLRATGLLDATEGAAQGDEGEPQGVRRVGGTHPGPALRLPRSSRFRRRLRRGGLSRFNMGAVFCSAPTLRLRSRWSRVPKA